MTVYATQNGLGGEVGLHDLPEPRCGGGHRGTARGAAACTWRAAPRTTRAARPRRPRRPTARRRRRRSRPTRTTAHRRPPPLRLQGAGQQLLDLPRIDVEPAGDDEVLRPSRDAEVAVGVELADVAGQEPAVAERIRGASGRSQYVRITFGPRTQISSLSPRRTSTPGSAMPTEPGRRSAPKVFERVHERLGHPVALDDRVARRVRRGRATHRRPTVLIPTRTAAAPRARRRGRWPRAGRTWSALRRRASLAPRLQGRAHRRR